MRLFLLSGVMAVCTLATTGLARAQTATPTPFPSVVVDRLVQNSLKFTKTPSMAVAVVENGKVVYARGFGLRDENLKLAANADTHYEIGSMTKQFTAAAILQLRDAGKIVLDAPLATYLPSAPHAKEITIRQLLNQTTGLYNYTQVSGFKAIAGKPGSYDQMVALIAKKPLEFVPGTKWRYSNTNYILLGRVIEVVSGEPYTTYLRNHVFKPADMTQTYTMQDEPTISNMARGYIVKKSKVTLSPPLQDIWAWSAGDIVSTVGDFAKWMDALSNGTVIPKSDYVEMTTSGRTTDGKQTDYGFGLQVTKFDRQLSITHSGGTFGYISDAAIFPNQHLSVVVFTNSNLGTPEIIISGIFNALNPQLASAALVPAAGENLAMTARIKAFIIPLLAGTLDRSKITPETSKNLTDARLKAASAQLSSFGTPKKFIYKGKEVTPDGTVYVYLVTFAKINLKLTMKIDKATNLFSSFYFGAT